MDVIISFLSAFFGIIPAILTGIAGLLGMIFGV